MIAIPRELLGLAAQAVVAVVRVVDREEAPPLGIEAEEQPVEEDQRVVEGGGQRVDRASCVSHQPLRNLRHRGEDLALESRPHGDRVRAALLERPVEERTPGHVGREGRGAEEGREIGKGLDVVLLEQGDEIDLPVGALDEIALGAVQAPDAAIGEDAPPPLRDQDVVDDLRDRIVGRGAG